MSYVIRIDAKGRTVIPAQLRAELQLEDGDELVARSDDGRLIVETRAVIKRRLREQARATGSQGSAVAELLTERRAQAAVEEVGGPRGGRRSSRSPSRPHR